MNMCLHMFMSGYLHICTAHTVLNKTCAYVNIFAVTCVYVLSNPAVKLSPEGGLLGSDTGYFFWQILNMELYRWAFISPC